MRFNYGISNELSRTYELLIIHGGIIIHGGLRPQRASKGMLPLNGDTIIQIG